MAVVPEFIKRPLRRRSLLLRPAVIRELTRIAEYEPTFGNQCTVFHSGDALYGKMMEDIAAAESRVLWECYMFLSDNTSWQIAKSLARKAREGVKVRFIYDSLGSYEAAPEIFEFLMTAGVEVLEYRPLKPWKKRFGVFGRDHRKILVIDDRCAYTGGFNVGDAWSETCSGEMAWRDTHLRFEGDAARDLTVLFAETWHRETGILLPIDREAVAKRRQKKPGRNDDHPGGALIIGGRGHYRRRIRRVYALEINRASNQLFLTNPYMVPDRSIRDALCRAADRGVDVRLLLPQRSDVPVTDLAGQHYFEKYLRRGIRIYLYQRSILHAKCMLVDGSWGMVGSANLDDLSLKHNLEVNAVILDAGVAETLQHQFWQDLEHARELELASWRRRSWQSKLYQWLASWLRPWL